MTGRPLGNPRTPGRRSTHDTEEVRGSSPRTARPAVSTVRRGRIHHDYDIIARNSTARTPVTCSTFGDVEMREIEAFLVVADELHFGRAAARLHITTGRVSQSVRALEREVGAPLFERTSRRVALTPLGTAFAARVRPAYEELGAALAEVARLWVAIGITTMVFRQISPVAACLLAPYWAWVSFATALNAAFWRLNQV